MSSAFFPVATTSDVQRFHGRSHSRALRQWNQFIANLPALSTSVSSFDFGTYVVGDNPRTSITVTNSNGASAGIAGISITGGPIFTQSKKCPSLLAAGASCTVRSRHVR